MVGVTGVPSPILHRQKGRLNVNFFHEMPDRPRAYLFV